MKRLIRRIKDWFLYPSLYVVADARDNSITFSRRLFQHIRKHATSNETKVLGFTVQRQLATRYAFMVNPSLDEPTQLAEIQLNEKAKTIGFECLVPTVNRIFYDYGLPSAVAVKLSVTICRTPKGAYYYVIERPKHTSLLCQK